ncbi:MAG: helix-turn-helix transcriptional regulator [Dehalococcoidia bacterium]
MGIHTNASLPSGLDALAEVDRQLLVALNEEPGQSAEHLAQKVFLSGAAVRRHLERLEAHDLIKKRARRRPGPGRPVNAYSLTSAGKSLFPQGYLFTLIAALDILAEHHPGAYDDLMARLPHYFGELGPEREIVKSMPPGARAATVLEWMRRYGHRATVECSDEATTFTVTHCAALAAAQGHPGICRAEHSWMRTYFPESSLTVKESLPEGGRRCVLVLSREAAANQPGIQR